ncbi:MAG: 4-hydroxy-tetrahydrodipicolinate synthase [Gammaproteobacteria bacterium]
MFHGSIVALVTPMHANGQIDFESLTQLIGWHIETKTHAIVILGTTGESPTVTQEERHAIIKHTIKHAANHIPVIVGSGNNSTARTIEDTQEAMELGADACLIITPYYNKPMQEGLYQHYAAIAKAVPIPQILYNAPGRTGCDLLPETVERLADIPNIIAIKESSGKIARLPDLQKRCGIRFDIFSGEDDQAAEFILQGGKGIISVTANVAPSLMQSMCVAALQEDRPQTDAINQKLATLHKTLFVESNPIPVKWALHEMGKIPPGIRLPLTPLAHEHHSAVKAAMKLAGI